MRTASSDGSSDNPPTSESTSATGDSFSPTDESSTSVARGAVGRREFLRHALGELTPRQRFVVECLYGFRGDRVYTTREVASFMGVTQRAVIKHHQAAIVKMRSIGTQSDLSREAFSDTRTSATNPSDGVEFESACLSPFVSHRHGYPPGLFPPGVAEYLYGDDE